ncbi:MAG: hypothetical protein WBB69_04520 [Anaerolineales bacterium]
MDYPEDKKITNIKHVVIYNFVVLLIILGSYDEEQNDVCVLI